MPYPFATRVGVGGGIGCPEAALAAFEMGAAFVVTGTINQLCRESGSSDLVRNALCRATYSDVTMAPAADMFEEGVQLQVLKKGTMFPARAKKLFEVYRKYSSLDAIPEKERDKLERKVLGATFGEVWRETRRFYVERLKDEDKVRRAEENTASGRKLKMSLVFRWYLSKSSGWANRGDAKRKLDYQIWCGPAIGSWNTFAAGTFLDPLSNGTGHFPSVVDVNEQLLNGACFLARARRVAAHPIVRGADASVRRAVEIAARPYVPSEKMRFQDRAKTK